MWIYKTAISSKVELSKHTSVLCYKLFIQGMGTIWKRKLLIKDVLSWRKQNVYIWFDDILEGNLWKQTKKNNRYLS